MPDQNVRMTFLKQVIISLIVMLLGTAMCLYSQQVPHNLHEFEKVQGLHTKMVFSVFKDSRGFIWFGCENGLFRYDGYEFKEFNHDPQDTTSISGNLMNEILFEDDEGNIWIGTFANGLNIYNPVDETFQHFSRKREYRFDFDFNVLKFGMQDKDGDVWLISQTSAGLINFDRETGNYKCYIINTVNTESWENRVSYLYEDRAENFWIGTYGGLFIFNKETRTFSNQVSGKAIPEQLQNKFVTAIFEDQEGIFWFGSGEGLLKYNPLDNKLDQFMHDENDPQSICSDRILDLFENPLDGGKSVWIMTGLGFNRFEKSTGLFTRFNNDKDNILIQAFGAMFDIFLEDNGTLWAATGFAGAVRYKLNFNPFSEFAIGPFDDDPNLYSATIFLDDKSGNFWVGSGYKGLFKYDQNRKLVGRYEHDPGDPNSLSYPFIYTLFEDSDSILWIGTAASLDVFDHQSNRFIHCSLPTEIRLSFTRVNEIYQDSQGILWLAASGGAYYQEKQSILDTSFLRADIVDNPLTEYRCITEDPAGNLWLGSSTGSGLFLLTPENRETMTFINYRQDPLDPTSISDDIVWSLHTDKEGVLWCGTSNGLNRFDLESGSFYCFNKKNGLDANFIYYIVGDDIGNLWLSTEKGIVRFTQISDTTARSKLLGREDGAPFDDNFHFKIFKDKNGKIYVCGRRFTGEAYYSFNPADLKDNDHIPPIVLTELLVKNSPMRTDTSITRLKHLKLGHDQNYFSLTFSALDYINPEKNNYAYMLEGFDEDWIYCENRRLVNYTNVPPGDYVFRVKGSNNDGLWNETGTSLRISIAAPPWKTWWAYSLYLILIITALYLLMKFYMNRQKLLHNLELKHLEATKLDELNQEKSRFFANISHEFRTPLTLIIGPVQKVIAYLKDESIIQDLKMSLRNAYRLQNLINQLLSLAKLESGKMELQAKEEEIVSLVRGYFQSFESAAQDKDIELIFKSSQEEIPVYVDRDKIEKILYNLFSNAMKFTPERGRIEVKVLSLESSVLSDLTKDQRPKTKDLSANTAIISISDTGAGISPTHLPHIFDRFYQVDDSMTRDQEGTGIGLSLVKELVELHHGIIEVESEVDKGTTFTVILPLGNEHLKEEEVDNSLKSSVVSKQSAPSLTDSPNLGEGRGGGQSIDAPTLLIVEDNADMRSYLRNCLGDDYQILEAGNGERGLEKALEHIPDLVISDVMMPKMDGYQLCHELKSDEKTSHIPVILLTARATLESKIEGLETGADDFVSKPFDALELQVRVKNLVDQRRKLTEKLMKNASSVGLSRILDLPETGITSMEEKFLQKTLDIIQQNLSDPEFDVEKFSGQMAMSRSQFYRKLHALTNMSPNEFIRFTRLHKAAELLTNHTANVAEIAYDVGFNNPSYFAECFKKQFGVLPSEYPEGNSK